MATKPGTAYTPPGYDDPNAAKPQVQDAWGRPPGDPQYGKSPTGTGGPAPTGQSSPMPGGSGTQPTGGSPSPSQPPSSTSQWTGSQPSSQPSSQNPLDLIKQYQSQNPGGKAQIPGLVQYLNSQGVAASIGTHAGGTQASDDKVVLPDGTYYDLASDTGWTAPGQAQHWDPNVNVMDPTTGQFVKYGDYLQGKGLSVPQFIPRPGDGLPMPNPAAAGGLYAPGQTGTVPGTASSPNFLASAPGGGGGPTVAGQTAQQLASAPNTSAGGLKGTLEGVLQGKMNQSLDINANDPIIQNQMNAYSAQQQGAARNYLQAAAEKAGPSGNISAETRSANERVGQANSAFQAQLMQQELTARRQEIMQSLQLGAGYITDEDKISLSKELAQLDNALQYARLGEQASEFGRSLAEQGSEFGQNLSQRQLESQMANQQFYSGLGQRSYEYDTTRSDNLFGGG